MKRWKGVNGRGFVEKNKWKMKWCGGGSSREKWRERTMGRWRNRKKEKQYGDNGGGGRGDGH